MAAMSPLRRRMIEDMTVHNLSPGTQRSYVHAVAKFSQHFGKSPDRLGLEDVRAYQVHLASKGMAWASFNQIVGALHFLQSDNSKQADRRRETVRLRRGSSRTSFVSSSVGPRIAATPHRLDLGLAVRGIGQLLAQLADKHFDDLDLGLVHAAIEMVEEHLLGQRRASAQAQEFRHLVLLVGEVDAGAVHFHSLGVEIDNKISVWSADTACPLRAAHDGVDARDQFVLMERLGYVVLAPKPRRLTFSWIPPMPERIRMGRLHIGDAQRPQNLEAGHVWKIQVEQNDDIIVELTEIDTFFAQFGGIAVDSLGFPHQLID
jgi:hypothetical protein